MRIAATPSRCFSRAAFIGIALLLVGFTNVSADQSRAHLRSRRILCHDHQRCRSRAHQQPDVARGKAHSTNGALRFDSSSYVELLNTRGLLTPDHEFTVELWVRAQLGEGGPFALLGDYVDGKHPQVRHPNRAGWFLGVGQTTGGTLSMSGGFGPLQTGGPLGVDAGKWYHVAATNELDGLSFYVNGKRWYQKFAADQIKWKPSPINLHLGKTQYDSWRIRDHQVDVRGLRISSTCLYHDEFEPPIEFETRPDTLVLLDFTSPYDETITDLSGHHHHGEIRGARWLRCVELSVADGVHFGIARNVANGNMDWPSNRKEVSGFAHLHQGW